MAERDDLKSLPPSETEPVRVNCARCDHALFVVIYDLKSQGSHIECAACGEVAFL